MIDWQSSRAELEDMVLRQKLDDHAIGERFGVGYKAIRYARSLFGLPINVKVREYPEAPAPLTQTVDGVTFCPPMPAGDIDSLRYTARPRGRK